MTRHQRHTEGLYNILTAAVLLLFLYLSYSAWVQFTDDLPDTVQSIIIEGGQ